MHEILIISGKGGTGKTSLTAAFAHLSQNAVLCDLDVDAPDLHLVLSPQSSPKTPFVSGGVAQIVPDKCQACGVCKEMCRFQAVFNNNSDFSVDPLRCEGCYVCVHFCPHEAIAFIPNECGYWRISETRFGSLVHAQLYPGEENSGKLVALLRNEAKQLARSKGAEILLSDGPPGIGCPVISALSGIDLVIIVTEPTPSGTHDLQRVVELCEHFRLPMGVIINKKDLNLRMEEKIKTFCDSKAIPILAQIPHSEDFVHAMVSGLSITEYTQTPLTEQLRKAWKEICKLAQNKITA
ncbi:MAG: ATP-binding protein [Desulfobacteraceae bacterium]|jgi:MinD superfamily P-loop ATPase